MIKGKKNHNVLEFNKLQWLKPYGKFNTQKIEPENCKKRWKSVIQMNEQ